MQLILYKWPPYVSVLVCALLASCGGNSSSDNDQLEPAAAALIVDGSLAAPADFVLFNDEANKAALRYSGVTHERGFNNQSVPVAITNAVFGAFTENPSAKFDISSQADSFDWLELPWLSLTSTLPFINFNVLRPDIPNSSGGDCTYENVKHGTRKLDRKAGRQESGEEVHIHHMFYENCKQSPHNMIFDGHVKTAFIRTTNERLHYLLFAFDDLKINVGSDTFLVNGTMRTEEPSECGVRGNRLYYLNVTNLSTNESVFLENYEMGFHIKEDRSCQLGSFVNNYYSGRVLNSTHGAFQVTTNEPLGQAITFPRADNMLNNSSEAAAGNIEIKSLNDTITLGITNKPIIAEVSIDSIPANTMTVQVSGDAYSGPAKIKHAKDLFNSGSFLDLNDNDQDGMNNSWEVLTGLNPQDASDADMDTDNDNRSALLEFEGGGHPQSSSRRGVTVDRSITLTSLEDKGYTRIAYIDVASHQDNYEFTSSRINPGFTVSASVPGEWQFTEERCLVDIKNVLVCSTSDNSERFGFVPEADGIILFEASVDDAEGEINPLNNTVQHTFHFERREHTLILNKPVASYYEAGREYELTARITHEIPSVSDTAWISVLIPDGVTVTSTKSGVNDNFRNQPCRSMPSLTCGSTISMRNGDYFDVRLTFTANEPGNYLFAWHTNEHPAKISMENNAGVTEVVILENNASALQALVDRAADGSTVTLPSGIYSGGLSMRNKQLVLRGSQGLEPTTMINLDSSDYSITDIGSNSVIQGIHFKGQGTPIVFNAGENLIVTQNVFESAETTVTMNGIVANHHPNEAINTDRDASYSFIDNEVKGFGVYGANDCSKVLATNGWRSVTIERNVFSDIACDYGVVAGDNTVSRSAAPLTSVRFVNNTMHNVNQVFSYSAEDFKTLQQLQIRNNIFHDVQTIIPDESLALDSHSDSKTNATHNIIYSSDQASANQSTSGERQLNLGSTSSNQYVNPMFFDIKNNNFRLRAGSPAIDSGASIDTHYPAPLRPTIQDGDLDGVDIFDIGAYEYSP